jgi:hypothetical protein
MLLMMCLFGVLEIALNISDVRRLWRRLVHCDLTIREHADWLRSVKSDPGQSGPVFGPE